MRQGGVLAYLAPKGWGGKRKGKMEEVEICGSQGLRFFSWGLSVFFPLFL